MKPPSEVEVLKQRIAWLEKALAEEREARDADAKRAHESWMEQASNFRRLMGLLHESYSSTAVPRGGDNDD